MYPVAEYNRKEFFGEKKEALVAWERLRPPRYLGS